ncbi:alkaline phosphatase family protein [Halococcus agarilyticus]|uniref:hypothetical protein n=1 Tax=Halococcus agarilyticus TaxID=1232219 RepID=UPI0006779FA0|nr:hypothetical protein [Halococcus agarilyticus]
MDTSSRLGRAINNPVLFFRYANRLYHRRFGRREHNTDGVSVFDEDWDNLLVLDACRYDMFARCSELPGRLERRQSKGSATTEFLSANMDDRDLRDTVYVTANPQLYRNRESIRTTFHDVIHVWQEEGWDEEYGTVLPETVTEYATRTAQEYPDKRLVVHYMQPHYPFIDSGTDFDKGHLTGARRESLWSQLLYGALDADQADVWRIYEANLERALPHVEELMDALDGKTVVTADHGNMVGERAFPIPMREWGHPRGVYTDELITVPWLVREDGPRRKIRRESPVTQSNEVDSEVVADRLRDLGYTE